MTTAAILQMKPRIKLVLGATYVVGVYVGQDGNDKPEYQPRSGRFIASHPDDGACLIFEDLEDENEHSAPGFFTAEHSNIVSVINPAPGAAITTPDDGEMFRFLFGAMLNDRLEVAEYLEEYMPDPKTIDDLRNAVRAAMEKFK